MRVGGKDNAKSDDEGKEFPSNGGSTHRQHLEKKRRAFCTLLYLADVSYAFADDKIKSKQFFPSSNLRFNDQV